MKFQITRQSKILLGILTLSFLGSLVLMLKTENTLKNISIVITLISIISIFIIVYFYRDPERNSTADSDIILAPADGMVVRVEKCQETKHLKGPALRIAIFMHVGNVHVQRIPSAGTLLWTQHQQGKFRAVLDPKAPIENEQRWYAFDNKERSYALVQIAGLLARRTISWLQPDQKCLRGERLGMIALGSEVDLYVPQSVEVSVQVGQKVKGGITPLGRWI
jgi:phosphatidylserine decarboxylase